LIHWQTEIWELEQRERDEITHHVEKLESSLAKHSDELRESIPNDYLRTLYDRQVGRTKGTYGFARSLIGTGVDAALLLQKLATPVGWFDPDLQRKLQQGYSFGLAVGKGYVAWEFGGLQEKKHLLEHVGAVAGRVYDEAKKSIQQQWAEAKRTGKQEELIEKWKTRIFLEAGTLFVGAGELRGASSATKGLDAAERFGSEEVSRNSSAIFKASSPSLAVPKSIPSEVPALSSIDSKEILRRHLEDVNNHEVHFALLAEQARSERNAARFRSYLGRITEAKGERAAAEYMQTNFKDFEMVAGFEPGPGIDQIWIKRNVSGEIEEIKIVEAKGPGARLAKGQMSKPWLSKKVDAMCNPRQDEQTQAIGKLLKKGLPNGPPKIQGLVVESVPKGGAKLKTTVDYN
jgi:hypothetical protein